MQGKEKYHPSRHGFKILLKAITIIVICTIIVWLLPKTGSFNYAYQKGMPWNYETLIATFDFPIHKTSDELKFEADRAISEQMPIFNINESVTTSQHEKFCDKLSEFKDILSGHTLDAITKQFLRVYQAGIILLPSTLADREITNVLVVKDNIATSREYKQLYTLKKAYSELDDFIRKLPLTPETAEQLQKINLNNFLQPNLEYDAQKTRMAVESSVRNISTTQGMLRKGEVIVSRNELITPEKYKILDSFKIEYEQITGSTGDKIRIGFSQAVLVLLATLSFSVFLYFNRKRLFYSDRDFFFLYCMFLLTVVMGSITHLLHTNILAIPVLLFPIIVNILFGKRAALYLLLGTTILVAYFSSNSYMYIFMQLVGGIVSIFGIQHLQRRGQLFLSIALIFVSYVLVYGSFTLIQQGTFITRDLLNISMLLINTLLLCLTYPILYLVEKLFGYTSEITLLEYSNPNHPVLRILTHKAPGTFQHSLMVANLAEEAIYRIGGSPLLARTGALYHDIGKIENPVFFIENQSGGVNPHDAYDFDESAQMIINHVVKGVELAHKYKLPEAITNFIRTHHGKSKAKYFYNSYRNKYPDRDIDEGLFTYPGPDPTTKECAVLMMADAVEAASRTLEIKNEENIRNLVSSIIDGQLNEGRFSNADITFKDITAVKRAFTELLINVFHARIAYPKLVAK